MSIDSRLRQPKGIPVGGQFASMSHLESGITLVDPERESERYAERREYLRRSGFVPAAILDAATAPATTAQREEWWDRSRVAAEYGAYPQMPDDYTPAKSLGNAMSGHRRTHRMRYSNGDVDLRMPSATAIKRFSKENGNPTFDVPVNVSLRGGPPKQAFVRVTMTGPHSWKVTTLGGKDTPAAEVLSEAVNAVLEARRPSLALLDAGNLLERRRRRMAEQGAEIAEIKSTFIEGIGYDEATGTMATQIDGKVYGHVVTPDLFKSVQAAERPGAIFNSLVKKQSPRASVTKCPNCARFSSDAVVHTCPTGHKEAEPIEREHVERARQRALAVASGRSAGVEPAAAKLVQQAPEKAPETKLSQPAPATKTGPPAPRKDRAHLSVVPDAPAARPKPLPEAWFDLKKVIDVEPGTEVLVDGKLMYKQAFEPEKFGNPDEKPMVMVGYGPGRYNRSISAAAIAAGYVDVRIPEQPKQQPSVPAHLATPIVSMAGYNREIRPLQAAARMSGFEVTANLTERRCQVACTEEGYAATISADREGKLQRFVNLRPVDSFDPAMEKAAAMEKWATENSLKMARLTDAELRRNHGS